MSVWAGDGEYSDVWNEITRKARKEHTCCACSESIHKGNTYHLITSIYDGRVESWKRCVRCDFMWQSLNDKMNLERNDEVPDMNLACGHEYKSKWGESPPEELAELAFLLPGETPGSLIGAV